MENISLRIIYLSLLSCLGFINPSCSFINLSMRKILDGFPNETELRDFSTIELQNRESFVKVKNLKTLFDPRTDSDDFSAD